MRETEEEAPHRAVEAAEDPRRIFTLAEVCQSIHKTISARYGSSFWLRAEMHKLNYYAPSGHCFPELCQKTDHHIVAEMRATLWSSDYKRINALFEQTLGSPLQEGTELLMLASVQYEVKYGLSLHIHDIDPVFTLGSLQKQRMECVARLKKENLYSAQRALEFPLLPKRVAIISAASSKGYSDFMRVLESRKGYVFETDLYTALLQGDAAVDSVLKALHHIELHKDRYDVVAIIRGGGGEVGLSGFDRYELASAVARFPLPVLSGIGHSTNLTVTEEVACFTGITPTEVGEFLLDMFDQYANALEEMTRQMVYLVENSLRECRQDLEQINVMRRGVERILRREHQQLEQLSLSLSLPVEHKIRWEKQQLEQWQKWLAALSPEQTLRRGYACVYSAGRLVKDAAALRAGDEVRIRFRQGEVAAEVMKPR